MFLENGQLGVLNLSLVFVVFGYYTVWVIGLPFVDPQVSSATTSASVLDASRVSTDFY